MTCDDGGSSPVTVKFEQPGGGRTVTGSMGRTCYSCFGTSSIYAGLVEALPWSITGTVSYKSVMCYPYYTYSAPLSGSLLGSPVSRISATTGPFKGGSGSRSSQRAGVRLELTRSEP